MRNRMPRIQISMHVLQLAYTVDSHIINEHTESIQSNSCERVRNLLESRAWIFLLTR
jgi:hypothetical protein